MFVIVLDYVVDLTEIDDVLSEHGAWLDEQYAAGLFLASGRREPRTGGVILAQGCREDIEAAVAADPFAVREFVRHTVIEFHPSKFGAPLDTDAVRATLA